MTERHRLDDLLHDALRSEGEAISFAPAGWHAPAPPTQRSVRRSVVPIVAAVVLCVGVAVPLVALSLLSGPKADPPRTGGSTGGSTDDDPRTWESCREEPLASHLVTPPEGPAETQIEIHGALDTGWQREPEVEEFQVWWNLDRDAWWTALGGHPQPAVEGQEAHRLDRLFLAYSGPLRGTFCPYQVIVRAPEAPAGTYPIVVLYAGKQEPPRWEALAPAEFTVTGRCPEGPGPWSDPDCPEAAWMLRVIEEAEFRGSGGTERAILVEQPDDPRFAPWHLYVQVMSVDDANRQGLDPSADGAAYPRSQLVHDTVVWSDEEQTVFSWDRGGVRVFVMPGPDEASFPPEAAYGLVSASERVPAPS